MGQILQYPMCIETLHVSSLCDLASFLILGFVSRKCNRLPSWRINEMCCSDATQASLSWSKSTDLKICETRLPSTGGNRASPRRTWQTIVYLCSGGYEFLNLRPCAAGQHSVGLLPMQVQSPQPSTLHQSRYAYSMECGFRRRFSPRYVSHCGMQ